MYYILTICHIYNLYILYTHTTEVMLNFYPGWPIGHPLNQDCINARLHLLSLHTEFVPFFYE